MDQTARRELWWPGGAGTPFRAGARARLFCLPFAGGGASVFHGWRSRARGDVDVVPLQLPGRESRIREAPFRRLDALVDALAPALVAALGQASNAGHPAPVGAPAGAPAAALAAAPYAFFGHSMGALIAYELTHRLLASGAPPPAHLFVSGARAPHLPPTGEPPLHRMDDRAFEAALRDFNGTPEAVLADRELMELVLPALRADFEVCETYQHQERAPLPCPITAFGGSHDRQVTDDALQAWGDRTRARFEVVRLEGDHFFVLSSGPQLQAQIERSLLRPMPGAG